MKDVFQIRNISHYNLRYAPTFVTENIHCVYNGSESASYLGPKIWEQIPTEIKTINSLAGFKKEIRKWKPVNCPCRICKVFIPNLGFLWFEIYRIYLYLKIYVKFLILSFLRIFI